MSSISSFNLDRVKFREPFKCSVIEYKQGCSSRIRTPAWVPLEHMLGMVNKPEYEYCMKYKCECTNKKETGVRCFNCGLTCESGFYCQICTFILNRDLFTSKNQNLKLFLMESYKIKDFYATDLHVIDIEKTIEWLKTFNPKKKTTLIFYRYWYLVPCPGYHLTYDYKELFDSYIKLYE